MFERVLVPIDASGESLAALPVARRLARAAGARLILLSIATAADLAQGASAPALAERAQRLADEAPGPGEPLPVDVEIRPAMRASAIPATIVAEAREAGADLIVMATHARSGLDRLSHPSVAEAVLADSLVPLLLVNATREPAAENTAAPILVAVDGTPEGAAALPVAAQYARALDAEILLLRVVAPRLVGEDSSVLSYDPAALDDAQRYLDQLAAQLNDYGIPAQGLAVFGPVAETIATVAEQVRAGAVALSTHSLRGMARLVHGSIADRLLRAESCPILLVRRDAERAAHQFSARHGALAGYQAGAAAMAVGWRQSPGNAH